MSNLKNQMSASEFEAPTLSSDSVRGKARVARLVSQARLALTALAFAFGVVILGTSASAVKTYRDTHLEREYMLPLWPENFNLRPTIALIVCGTIIVPIHGLALLVSRVNALQNSRIVNIAAGLLLPGIGFTIALISMTYYYIVNASDHVDTIQSWSCRWKNVAMTMEPHFGTICRQHEASVVLTVMLVPLEILIAGVVMYQMVVSRSLNGQGSGRKNGSPAPFDG